MTSCEYIHHWDWHNVFVKASRGIFVTFFTYIHIYIGWVVYTNIDQTLMSSLHGLLTCNIVFSTVVHTGVPYNTAVYWLEQANMSRRDARWSLIRKLFYRKLTQVYQYWQ